MSKKEQKIVKLHKLNTSKSGRSSLYRMPLFFILLFPLVSFIQQRLETLKFKLVHADSVIIVSHETIAGISLVNDLTGRFIPLPKLIVKGRINDKIVHERFRLGDTLVRTLAGIISRSFQDTMVERGMCFLPHHAVIYFKSGKASYVDMCFGCRRIETSEDIKITEFDFDDQKWDELVAFYEQQGIRYELTNESLSEEQ